MIRMNRGHVGPYDAVSMIHHAVVVRPVMVYRDERRLCPSS